MSRASMTPDDMARAPADTLPIAVADVCEALDEAAILFDADWRCIVFNRRFARTFYEDDQAVCQHQPFETVMRLLLTGGRVALMPGFDLDGMVVWMTKAIRGYRRSFDVEMCDGGILIGSANPIARGGCLLTFRDRQPDIMGELQALGLLGEAFQSADMGMILWDASMTVLTANAAWGKLLGPVPLGISGREYAKALIENGLIKIPHGQTGRHMVEGLFRLSQRRTIRTEGVAQNGRRLMLSSFRTPTGGVMGTATDVTDLRSAEARVSDALNEIVESLEEGVALYDSDMRLRMSNEALHRMVDEGHPRMAYGTHLADHFSYIVEVGSIALPDGVDTADFAAQMMASARGLVRDAPLAMSDGRILHASSFLTAMGGYLITLRDVTEKLRVEAAERETDQLVRTIVDASPTTLMVSRVDDGRVIFAPPATSEQVPGLDMTRDVTDPTMRGRYLDALLPTGRLKDWPMQFRRSDGGTVHCLTSARVVEFRGEHLIVSSSLDVTERLALEAELDRQRETSHQNEKLSALGELLAGVAHELNNPLSVVVGHTMMLSDEVDDPVLARRIDKITSAAQRSARIVKMFLAMARQRPARFERCDLNDLVRTALDVSAYGLRAMGAKVLLDLDATLPWVRVDPDQIAQVISNLIVNAEHALQRVSGAHLSITTKALADKIEISVSDNGPGVPEALRSRIFEPFFTTKDVGVGTGVGLAFCHRIVTTHGGRLLLHPETGVGSTFVIELPRRRVASAKTNLSRTENAQAARILVIDDEADVGELVGDVLRHARYEVTVCRDAVQALDLCRSTAFDLILSDIRMPGMDGCAFLDALMRQSPSLGDRVAFLTSDAMGPEIEWFLARSNRPHAEKPLSPTDVLSLVERLLQGGHA